MGYVSKNCPDQREEFLRFVHLELTQGSLQEQNLRLLDQGSGKVQLLSGVSCQLRTPLLNHEVQSAEIVPQFEIILVISFEFIPKPNLLECPFDFLVRVLVERVHVVPNCAIEAHRGRTQQQNGLGSVYIKKVVHIWPKVEMSMPEISTLPAYVPSFFSGVIMPLMS